MEDTNKELERLQKELLKEQPVEEDLTEDLPTQLTEDSENLSMAQILGSLLKEQEEEEELQEQEEVLEEVPEEQPEAFEEAPQEEAPAQEQELVVDDAMLEELMAEVNGPAFDDPDVPAVSDETMVFHNFSNDYGKDLAEYGEPEENPEEAAEIKKRDDKVVFWLMVAASGLCAGILGVLAYWLIAFL